ncbi:hypothetical protein FDE76_15800 [Clostridium botulinum]|uniref:Uncharacterized protein n=1 Tax=Clostridium botulinum (strain Eklund 17B / Type B) TaxID=935198 RepID=B2TNW9_CLOBB|nr:hypothetical protein CLL_A2738 [Clostridium botulinum B str. Eklund 17B (NRP)]MBY6976238.1 hypothetical protein [Clostridium botulinum]MBY7000663.1 hypothetical protein [Clostridium botulinum]MCR1273427.1 hypothetical protein [Clostridium botulinum]NFD71313.1 hypothetical protein [Clostridium botulinum]
MNAKGKEDLLNASEVKNGSMTATYIKNRFINSLKSITLNIKSEICIGKLMCYEVNQESNNKVFTKNDLEKLLGEKFDITIDDNDYENANNSIIKIKSCYMYKYSHFISAGNIRMIQYEFSFQKENKQEIIKS